MPNSIKIQQQGNTRIIFFDNGKKRVEKIVKGEIKEIGEINFFKEDNSQDFSYVYVEIKSEKKQIHKVIFWDALLDCPEFEVINPFLYCEGAEVEVAIILEGENTGEGYISPDNFHIIHKNLFDIGIPNLDNYLDFGNKDKENSKEKKAIVDKKSKVEEINTDYPARLEIKEKELFDNIEEPKQTINKENKSVLENDSVFNIVRAFFILTVIGVTIRGCTGLITGEGFGIGIESHSGNLIVFGIIGFLALPIIILYFLKDKF